MGGLHALRQLNRHKLSILAFHSFSAANEANVAALATYIVKNFEPVSLPYLVNSLQSGKALAAHTLAVTVDDGYRNYALHGHPIFKRHKIPVTLFAVAGFADGRLWLWPDQIEYGLEQSAKPSITVEWEAGGTSVLVLGTQQEKADSIIKLTEALKTLPNQQRLKFMADFSRLCGVEIPTAPPPGRAPLNWDELRALAADGVEIGCHTDTHPILTRLESPAELTHEIKGAKELLEAGLRRSVRHFCYPNGKAPDINDSVVAAVREAGFESAVTCFWGLNTIPADLLLMRRLPFDSSLEFAYAKELLTGLHV
jgi:peptidoglycan/xylan/chitin deacetylase (PgdA/CDA1 family)